nr:TPA_asm: RdRp [Pterovirus sp. 'diachasmae']
MLLQHTVTEKPSVYKYMSNFLRIPIKKPETIVPLCKDPYSLPGDRPNLPSIILRKMLFESLRSMIRHEDLLSLYKAYDSGYTEKIEKCLRSANVYNPKVFSLIYSSTPTGQIEELTRKFESSRSVHEVLILRRGKRRADGMLRRVIRAERKLQRWRRGRMDRVNTRGTHPILHLMTDCPAESAQRMREYAWGKPVEGITTPPLQHLIKITTPYFTSDPAWDSQNAFLLNYYPATTFLPGHENESCWGAGPKDPFLGHRTSSGTLLPTARMVEQDPILSKIRTNLELISWTDRKGPDRDGQIITSNCPQLLEHIVKSYTSLDIRDLSHFGATHTYGTIDHHLAERKFKSTIARNTLSNVYTQYDGDSTYNKRISRAPGHYYINYLAIFCHGVMTTSLPLCFEPTLVLPPQMWLVVNPCSVCCRPIRETPIFMDLAPIATLRPPKLLTTAVGKRALGLLREAVEEFNSRDFRDIPTDASLTVEDATLGILQEMVDHTQSDKRRLEERYTDHNLTESGQKTLSALQPRTISAGFTHHEFNTLSPEHMLGPICSIVYDYCNLMFTGVCSDRIAEYISQLPIEQLPWYSIISKLYAMNLLKLFLKVVERRRGVRAGVAYVNVLHATSYLAEACLYLTERWVVPPSCVYLTHYHLSKFKLHFSRSLRFAFKTWMNIRIDPLLRESHDAIRRGGPTTEMFERALRSHITLIGMMLSCEIFQEDHINDLLQDLEENGVIISPFINSSDLDYDIYQEAEEVRRENGLDALMIRYPELPWGSIDALEEEEFSTNLINLHDLTSSFRMRIVCTTSLDCVNTLKSYVPEDAPEEEDLEDLMQKILDFSILPKPTLEAKPGQVLEVPKSSFTGALVRPRIDPLSFTDSKLILDRSLLFRPYGDATLAISKQCEIWCRMNMPKTVERPLSIAVFGDGLGGTSTFYTVVAPGSHLLLVTLPDKPGDNGIPPLTETYARRYGCTLDGHLVAEETSDVSKIETMRKIEVSPRTYDLVISDIEYKWIESCESYIIMNNICVFYLRRRSLDGILIAQVKLSEPNVIYAMCRILVPHCQHVRVLKIRSSTRHEQAYLVAWGSTKVFVGDYNIPASGESTRVYDAIFKFVARCHQNYVSECDHTNIALDIRSLSWPYHKHWVGILPYKLEISMYKRLAVRMDFYSLSCLIKTQPNLASVYAVSLPESIDRQIAETLEYFDSSRHPHIRHLTSDMNTRKHAQRTYERFLLLKGFRDSYTTLSSPTGVRVTDIMIRTMYKEILVTAPARLRIPAVSGAHFKSKMMVDKIKISPYSHYFSGWTIGIEFCSLITMLYKYRDRL